MLRLFALSAALAGATVQVDLPELFAGELAQGEIGMLIHYLAQAAEHVPDLETRERMQALVHRLTDWTGAEQE